MKLNDVKDFLKNQQNIAFRLPDGSLVPSHFHVTEVGKITKHFIDCGGTIRNEEVVNFQLWSADDYDHRLHPEKLVHIVELSQDKLGIGNLEVEVEYQGETIGKYGLEVENGEFVLATKATDCLARENCGVPSLQIATAKVANACGPNSGCC